MNQRKDKGIYTYKTPWVPYVHSWFHGVESQLIVGSFQNDYINQFNIIKLDLEEKNSDSNEEKSDFQLIKKFDHPYPATKVMTSENDLIITSGDYLRVWRNGETTVSLFHVLNNNKHAEYCAPITSFDWNVVDTSMIVSSSIDTTCTIWDIHVRILPFSMLTFSFHSFLLSFHYFLLFISISYVFIFLLL